MGNRESVAGKVNVEKITTEVNAEPLVMYTKASCGYCKKAKNLLNEQKIDYAEHDLDKISRSQPNGHQEYLNGLVYLTHSRTVPQIFICGKFIGGFTELSTLNALGRLKAAVDECAQPFA